MQNNSGLTWQERSNNCIAQACTTYSKRYTSYVQGVFPTHVESFSYTKGTMLCNDQKEYIDFGGLGANIIGSENNWSLPHVKEVALAEMIKERVPFIEKIKFLKTGSAACEMAIRFARAFMDRSDIMFVGYHGSHDAFIGQEIPGSGCVAKNNSVKFDNIDLLNATLKSLKITHNFAAVIVEPVVLDDSEEHIAKLKELRKLCTMNDILLIFDEVVSFLRYPDYCVSNHHNITPDLICFGKAIGNGYPLAVLGGRAEIMDNPDVFCSNTHNGELSGIEAGIKTLNEIDKDRILLYWNVFGFVKNKFNEIPNQISTGLKLELYGINTRWTWQGDESLIALFWQEMCYKGWILGKSMFPKFDWGDDILNKFLNDSEDVLLNVADNNIQLIGKLPEPVFKRY